MEKVLKYATLGGALLVFLGVLKLAIYFDYFGISITHYIDTTTALTLFLEDYQTIIVLLSVGFVHITLSENIHEKFDKVGGNILEMILVKYRWLYLIVYTALTIVMTLLIIFNKVRLNDFVIYLTCFGYVQFFVYLFMKRKKDSKGKWIWEGMYFERIFEALAFSALIMIIPLISLKEIRDTEKNDKDIILHMDDGTLINTRNDIMNLRKAGNYYFLKDEKTNASLVINADKVSKVELLD